jgi:hypothetical protein
MVRLAGAGRNVALDRQPCNGQSLAANAMELGQRIAASHIVRTWLS